MWFATEDHFHSFKKLNTSTCMIRGRCDHSDDTPDAEPVLRHAAPCSARWAARRSHFSSSPPKMPHIGTVLTLYHDDRGTKNIPFSRHTLVTLQLGLTVSARGKVSLTTRVPFKATNQVQSRAYVPNMGSADSRRQTCARSRCTCQLLKFRTWKCGVFFTPGAHQRRWC